MKEMREGKRGREKKRERGDRISPADFRIPSSSKFRSLIVLAVGSGTKSNHSDYLEKNILPDVRIREFLKKKKRGISIVRIRNVAKLFLSVRNIGNLTCNFDQSFHVSASPLNISPKFFEKQIAVRYFTH